MTTWSQLYPKPSILLSNVWFREPVRTNFVIPNNPSYQWLVAIVQGCGGMGEYYGGGGALAKSKRKISPGESLQIQVGDVSTASVNGDSSVKRANNVVIAYADRGRGNGNAGLAVNSTGDLKLDGTPGIYGNPASDLNTPLSMGFGGYGLWYPTVFLRRHIDAGGGGNLIPTYNSSNTWDGGYVSTGAGTGTVLLQFYDSDPGSLAW